MQSPAALLVALDTFLEQGTYLISFTIAELIKNAQRLLPGGPGRVKGCPRCSARVSEVDQCLGLVVRLAEVLIQLDCFLIARDGLVVVSEVVLGLTKAVECISLVELIPDLPLQVQGTLAIAETVAIVTQLNMEPANSIEGSSLTRAMPGSRKQPQGSLCMRECLEVATLAIKQPRHRTMGMRLTDMVGEASVKIQCLQQVLLRIAVVLDADVGISEAAMGNRLTAKIGPTLGRPQGHRLGSNRVMPTPTALEKGSQCPGQLPGVSIEAAVHSLPNGGE